MYNICDGVKWLWMTDNECKIVGKFEQRMCMCVCGYVVVWSCLESCVGSKCWWYECVWKN